MASSPYQEQPPQLHYTTWVLKVSIHCPGCKRKVKKVLRSIEGVYTIDIDSKQQKVIVTGNVKAETLIKKLVKNGRSAELWPKPKPSLKQRKPKNDDDNDDDDDDEQEENEDNEKRAENNGPQRQGGNGGQTVRFGEIETFTLDEPQNVAVVEKFPIAEQKPAGGGGGGGGGAKKKKKKKKKKSGNNISGNANPGSNGAPANTRSEVEKVGPNQVMDQANLHHPSPNPYSNPSYSNPYDQNPPPSYYAPQQTYVVSYNSTHPKIIPAPAYYHLPSSPYMHSDIYSKQSAPLDSFEILSDENPHACYIM